MRNWGVLVAEHQKQKLLQENLSAVGTEHFVPMVPGKGINRGGRHVQTYTPLLGRYVLFRIVGDLWKELVRLRGAAGILLTAESNPARVDSRVVEYLSEHCVNGIYQPKTSGTCNGFTYGQRVRPLVGPLAGHTGIFDGTIKRNREAALFFLFGRQQRIVFKHGELEAV